MNKKKNYVAKVMVILLTCILFITGIGIENISAFWNNDNPAFGDKRQLATITIQLIHCYHNDANDPLYSTHYDSSGRHQLDAVQADLDSWKSDKKNNPSGRTECVMTNIVYPGVLGNTLAGLESIDTNKYFYEYSLTYAESELVDYVLITQPEITHYSDNDSKRPDDLREDHVRMYWIGSYNKSMTEVTGKWTENGYDENDTDIGWWDFKNESFPTIDPSLSQQTWETVGDHEAFQNNKSFVFTKTMGENGMEFIYLLEGTKTVNANDGSFLDITEKDGSAAAGNHSNLQDTGVPLGYGGHVNAVIGIVFYNTVNFDTNGGIFDEDSVYTLHTYKDSKQAKAYVLHTDGSGNWVDGTVDISNPKYGNVSVKAPTRYGYRFSGWYAAKTGDNGKVIKDALGNVELMDIPLYDVNGQAVRSYTDSNGNTQPSPYFDSDGNWIYKGNVTAAAKWEYLGTYYLHYDKGATNYMGSVLPDDGSATLGDSITVADGRDVRYNIQGSDYNIKFEVYTNNGGQNSKVVQPVNGRFPFVYWNIEGGKYNGGSSYLKADVKDKETVTAAAVYDNVSLTLPSTSCKNGSYRFVEWYRSYDSDTQTFGGYAGKAGDTFPVRTSGDSVKITLYAKWEKADISLALDYNIPSTARNNRELGYIITDDEVKTLTVQHDSPLGKLPAPTLTGYRLNTGAGESIRSDGWSTRPNIIDDNGEEKQVNVPVYSGTLYDGSYDTLYAQWEPTWYTIEYNLDGGSVSHENPKEYINYYKEITIHSPTKDGSTFLGWDITGMDGNKHIIDGKLTDMGLVSSSGVGRGKTCINVTGLRADDGGTVTFTALWKDTGYSISYDYRDAVSNAGLTPDSDPGNPSGYTRNTPTFTLKNPAVRGYYAGPLWGGTGITGTIPSVTIEQGSTGNRSYTAYFNPVEYEILYDLSGGSWGAGASHPNSAKYNRSFTVSHPVMEGCNFAGWEITRMCDDCGHKAGNSIITGTSASGVKETVFMNLRCNSAEKVLFTAKWSHAVYDIHYELNGGSWTSDASHPESAETYTSFYINNPVRNDYTFAGWMISGMDNGLHYLPSGNTTAGSASSVGTGKKDGMALTYGNLRYSAGTVTFKAAWLQDTRQVAFFGNGGSMTGAGVRDDWTLRFTKFGGTAFFEKYEYDAIWGTDMPKVSKTGYTFKGYYDALAGGNQTYRNDYSKVTGLYWDSQGRWIGPSLILYAQFIPNDYSVTFDTNGGYWSSDNGQGNRVLGVTYDSTKNNKAYGQTDLYRPGYTFLGWGTNPDGTGHAVYDINGYNTDEGSYWSEDYRK